MHRDDDNFQHCFERVVGHEGDYSDHPSDSGGKTRYGITEAVAREHGYLGDMRELPFATAREIYRVAYWNLLQLDRIAARSLPIAYELFDTGVNTGVGVAAEFLQRALNVLNRRQRDWPDLKVDGRVGPVTLRNLLAGWERRGPEGAEVLLKILNCLQGARYVALAERREKDEDFVFGWIRTRVSIPSMPI